MRVFFQKREPCVGLLEVLHKVSPCDNRATKKGLWGNTPVVLEWL